MDTQFCSGSYKINKLIAVDFGGLTYMYMGFDVWTSFMVFVLLHPANLLFIVWYEYIVPDS